LISFILLLSVKADLTKDQENDLASFAENFIIEGNKRLDKNGYPLLAYMQGQARIDGYQSKLYRIGYDYNHKNSVNALKWTFDCASYASFVYYHTFNLILTYSTTSSIDPYSGLKIRSATANPYQVKEFVADADRGEHFYYIRKGVTGANINFNELKKGDLIIYVGHHIMVYIGDGKIAEATTSCISKDNLGMQVIPLTSKYSTTTLSIIRVKNKIISPDVKANTKVTWLDTNETVELVKKVDPVEEYPKINYTKPSTNWAKSVKITFKLSAINGLKSYSFSNDQDNWETISGNSYNLEKEIKENGTYYLKVKDNKDYLKTEKI
jgi:cell wall-associated NlpC family hydrolase